EMPRWQAWVMASRPRTLTAAAAPVVLGTGLAIGRNGLRLGPALAALLGALLIQVGTNLANDYYDHLRGGDTEDRVGPVRVTQAGIIPPKTVRNGAFLILALAFLLGLYLAWVGGLPVVLIGLASLLCAVAYTGGPFPLAYHGLGDLFVFVFFGLVAVGGTFWVQALAFRPEVLLAGAGMGAMATAILVVNNLRDIKSDTRAGKRTLAVRIGPSGTKVEFALLLVLGFSVPFLGVAWYGWTPWTLLTLFAALLLVGPLRIVMTYSADGDPRALIPALGKTAQAVGLYGLLLGSTLACF
ncbi:MAG: 1,4-dihydroxy-2-naphthoate polyprenyltransferase, partial [Longimicrobiales bacterium]|nr:1,4-dihydroxy-2-naphthoate polyprenyltransferase [Longimicrobiales bacterium]